MANRRKTDKVVAHDVFLSYRRDGGATVARLLCDVLEKRGITVFFDTVTLGAGDFGEAIGRHLEAAKNVVFIVSPDVFERCNDENDWVRKELELSLAAKKNIIPVFVNGETGFPNNLPGKLPEIAKMNACTLNHEHFDDNLRTLLSRLITPRHQMIQAYLVVDGEMYENNLQSLFDVCVELGGDEGTKEIQKMLSDRVRHYWENSGLTDDKAIDALLSGSGVSFAKNLCKALEIDNTGGLRKLKRNLVNWLERKEDVPPYNSATENEDRVFELVDIFSELFKSKDRAVAKGIADILNVTNYSAKSSHSIVKAIFEEIDIEIFFDKTCAIFDEKDIKDLSMCLFEQDKGRKQYLIEKIVCYVNYEDQNE